MVFSALICLSEHVVFLQGEHLHSGFGKTDIRVLIDELPCNVTNKTESVMKCKPTFKESFVGDGKRRVVQVRKNTATTITKE